MGLNLATSLFFWDRLALNMILIGPGISSYKLEASLGSNLSQADRQKLLDAINDALTEKFPGYGGVIDDGEFQSKGSSNTTSLGYRYMVQLGFRF